MTDTPKRDGRARAVERAQQLLLRRGSPRLHMSLILLLTGSVGFLISFGLLRVGVTQMWLRYPVAILLAYSAFLLLLRLWLHLQRPRERHTSLDVDPSGVSFDLGDALSEAGRGGATFGGGGDFGGGGAGGSWSQSMSGPSAGGGSSTSGGGGSGLLDKIDIDVGDDGCAVVLAVIALAAALAGALFIILYVVYAAPALLAEILVDGLLVAGLYKQLKKVEQRHWLRAAVRKTLLPMLIVLVLFTVAGYAMQSAAPEARSIGGFWKHVTTESDAP